MSEEVKLSVTLGYTLNLGNFQSLRVDIGCTDFVRSEESKEDAVNRIYKFVEEQVISKVDEAKKELE
jgi:hypothetical protein